MIPSLPAPIEVVLPAPQLCEDSLTAEQAATWLLRLGHEEQRDAVRQIARRIALGRVLLETQRLEFWREWGYKSWTDFLYHGGFQKLSGLEGRTGQDCIHLASSTIPQELLEGLPSLSHARHVVKMERIGGETVTPEQITEIASKPARELTINIAGDRGGAVHKWLSESEKVTQLQRIVDALAPAGVEPLRWLADLLHSDMVRAYVGNTPNLPDFLLGVMTTSALEEIRETYAHMCEELGPEMVEVLARHGWRCTACGKFLPLQAHHIKFRSAGGSDAPENLEPRCQACHEKVHGR